MSLREARQIRAEILEAHKKHIENHKVSIEFSPVHSVGENPQCDADRTKIIVVPLETDTVKFKT